MNELKQEQETKKEEIKLLPGRGLDVGTGFIVCSQMSEDGEVYTKTVRDSFLEIKPANKLVRGTMKKGFIKAGLNFFESDESFLILGEDSLVQSVERQMIVKRPMSKGVISPKEAKALPMFKALLKELLGDPLIPGEQIVYSIPAAPTDAPFDISYHEKVIESILDSLGYKGSSINEAQAIVLSELGDEGDDYTGIALSFGAGMTNVCISNMADIITAFAVAKGGDYVDYSAATSLGYDPKDASGNDVTPNLVTYVKENGVNIVTPESEDRVQIAISAYYKQLIRHAISNIILEIERLESKPRFLKPIKIVVSGGTSLAGGFIKVFTEELNRQKDQLPFEIKEICHASKPLTAVAEGALLALLSEME